MKKCNKCGRELNESMFHKNKASKDGLVNTCKNCKAQYDMLYRSKPENRERNIKYLKDYYSKPENKERAKQSRNNNRQDYLLYMQKYHQNEQHKQREYEARFKKYHEDIHYKLDITTVSLFNRVLSGRTKISEILPQRCGYTAEDLRKHIESQFTPEMNWNNYGIYWELDHITPRFKFYYESYNDEQFKQCWALNNLRPLEITVNRCRSKI